MRWLGLLFSMAVLSAEAPPPAEIQQYEQAMVDFHYNEARAVVDKLIRERQPSSGKSQPDPLLNAMIGRLYLLTHYPSQAAIYLDHAPIAGLPDPLRAPTALDHGKALDLLGDRVGAMTAYRDAATASENEDQRHRASIGTARELLPQNAAGVRELLLPIANGPSEPRRWEARYLLALSSSLLGDEASARQWADEAWADALTAPLTDLAPLQVETLRAGLAVATGDTTTERAMLTAMNGLALTASSSLSTQLPVCGDSGLRQSDFVIFGFVAGPFLTRELVPIAASRPEAVLPFQDALGGRSLIAQDSGETPVGTVFTVRCRTVVSPFFVAERPAADPLSEWTVDQGLYPASVFNESDDEHLKRVDDWMDTLSARFGKESPLLIMPRWQLLTMLETRALAGDPVLPEQIADLSLQIATGLKRAGAPDWLASYVQLPVQAQVAAQRSKGASNPATQIEGLYREQLLRSPFDMSRQVVVGLLADAHGDWPPQAAQMVLDLDAKASTSLAGRDRQAWRFLVAEAQRMLGKDAEARATFSSAGFSSGICAADDSDPKLLEQHFSYNDYPQDLIAGEQEGTVLLEFGLNAAGAPANPRILYSLPSGLFDQVSEKGLSTVRYAAPARGGKPVSCHGVTQPVRWQLDNGANFPVLTIVPQSPGPTT